MSLTAKDVALSVTRTAGVEIIAGLGDSEITGIPVTQEGSAFLRGLLGKAVKITIEPLK